MLSVHIMLFIMAVLVVIAIYKIVVAVINNKVK